MLSYRPVGWTIVHILAMWVLFLVSPIHTSAQNPVKTSQTISVAPHETARSSPVHLDQGQVLEVGGNSDDGSFEVDLFIYDPQKTLVARDNEDQSTPVFSWQAPTSGDFYVLARNLSGASGSITLRVEKAKALFPAPGQATVPDLATVKVFYATDRKPTGQGLPQDVFGAIPDPGGQLHLGECLVTIPRDAHKMGELEGPSIFRLEFSEDPSKHIHLEQITSEDQGSFLRRIADRAGHSNRHEALVFVHGFNTTFSDATRRTAQIAYDLGFDGPAILYSWPSQGRVSLTAYNEDGRNADLTVPHFQQFLNLLASQSGITVVHVIGHSMGGRVLSNTLKAISSQAGPRLPMFDQVVLMAPDIDAALFAQMAQQLRPTAQRITLYASSRDDALKASSALAGYPRAGQAGTRILVFPGIETIDASSVDTSSLGLFHQYYADNRTVLSDMFYLLRDYPITHRFGLASETSPSGTYWELKSAAR